MATNGQLCTSYYHANSMEESQFRLMDSTSETEVRRNFKGFSSGKKKCSFATSHKWSVSGRRERFGFLV